MKTDILKNITLINADCMDVMRTMPDKAFDLAIVDPPYRNKAENHPTKDMRNNGTMECFGDKPDADFFKQLRRVSKQQITWGANNFEIPPYKGFVVWKKKTIGEKFTMSMAEIASLSEGLGTTSKVFTFPPQDPFRIHPTQKPVELYKWLLKNYAKPGDKILDTHLGSGSICIACDDLGFEMTGIELDPDYYQAARKRLINHQAQQKLF